MVRIGRRASSATGRSPITALTPPLSQRERYAPHPNPLPEGEGVLFAIRYSLFAIRCFYRSPLATRHSLFLPFAIRSLSGYSPPEGAGALGWEPGIPYVDKDCGA
jgi:hypothetical protein